MIEGLVNAAIGAATPPAGTTGEVVRDSPPLLAVLLLAFGILLAIYLLLRHQYLTRPRAAAARAPARAPDERMEEIRRRAEAADPLRTVTVEATELARRLGTELDNKAERLEQLLAEADERIAALEAAREPVASHGLEGTPPAGRRPLPPDGETRRTSLPQGDRHRSPAPPADASRDPFVTRVYQLADEGLEPLEIARRLDQGVGKVELVLGLRGKRGSQP